MRNVVRNLVAGTLCAVALAPTAWSFCGFYVATEPGALFNTASKVVLARDGDHTVLTMASDYQGDPSEFGLVVPVPQEIRPDMVKIAEQVIVAKLDQYTVPRLAEYWDPDPCPEPQKMSYRYDDAEMDIPSAAAPPMADSADLGVRVEQKYSLEEYDIMVIQATTGRGLEQWLVREGYTIPEGASPVLDSYIRQNMHFFLAKIDISAQKELGVKWPRPLRVSYDSPKFMLPIRLGTVNARGPQDLLIYALTRQGRVETTNYRTARMPTDVNVPEVINAATFPKFYAATFERQILRDDMRSVYLEYAWPLSVVCDPCAGEQLTGAELQALGAEWATDYHGGMEGGFVTRLHVRYDRAHFPEDLVFQQTADNAPWQARYVVHHPFTGDTSCAEGKKYKMELLARRAEEMANLSALTGWSNTDLKNLGGGQ